MVEFLFQEAVFLLWLFDLDPCRDDLFDLFDTCEARDF